MSSFGFSTEGGSGFDLARRLQQQDEAEQANMLRMQQLTGQPVIGPPSPDAPGQPELAAQNTPTTPAFVYRNPMPRPDVPRNVMAPAVAGLAAGFAPGAGFVMSQQDANRAAQNWQQGNYIHAIADAASSIANAGLEAVPGAVAARRGVAAGVRTAEQEVRAAHTAQLAATETPQGAHAAELLQPAANPYLTAPHTQPPAFHFDEPGTRAAVAAA